MSKIALDAARARRAEEPHPNTIAQLTQLLASGDAGEATELSELLGTHAALATTRLKAATSALEWIKLGRLQELRARIGGGLASECDAAQLHGLLPDGYRGAHAGVRLGDARTGSGTAAIYVQADGYLALRYAIDAVSEPLRFDPTAADFAARFDEGLARFLAELEAAIDDRRR